MKRIIVGIIRFVIRLVARVEMKGYENIPEKGGFVIAVNHLGFLDAPLAYYALDNWNLFIPVAEKWADYAILRWLGVHLNAIFVDRFNPDLKAMREMIKRMEEVIGKVQVPQCRQNQLNRLQTPRQTAAAVRDVPRNSVTTERSS